jgi:hypothetical protein
MDAAIEVIKLLKPGNLINYTKIATEFGVNCQPELVVELRNYGEGQR